MNIKKAYPYLAIIFICLIAYLPFLGKQGFYKDDWYQIWAGTTQGASTLIKMFSIDRPGLGILYAITHKILGDNLILWHCTALVSRIVMSLLLYWLAKIIFNKNALICMLIATSAAIYPGFLEQPFVDNSLGLFIAYGICIFSVLLSLKACLEKRNSVKMVEIFISVITELIYLFIFEYFIGMELLRIFLFSIIIKEKNLSETKKSKEFKTISKRVIPYITTMFIFLIWRIFIFKSARSTTDIGRVLSLYITEPLTTMTEIILEFVKSIYNAVIQAWAMPMYTLSQRLTTYEFLIALVLSIGTAIGIYFLIKHFDNGEIVKNKGEISKKMVLVGLMTVVFTIIPIIFVGRKVNFDSTFIHYTLLLIFGVVTLIIGLLYSVISNNKVRAIFLSGLFLIAILTQFANGIYYSKVWELQSSLWWQLSWRAPGLKDDTTLVVFTPSLYHFAEAYEIWAPANLIFNDTDKELKVVAEVPNDQTIPLMLYQMTYGEELRRVEYTVDFKQMLILSAPHSGVCMHVFDGQNSEISSYEEPEARLVYSLSNAGLIDIDQANKVVNVNIFGAEPEHSWCFYYQKASLARQKRDWDEIISLGLEVFEKNLQPVDLSEWMPFYEGFVRGNRIDLANEVGALIRQDSNFILSYCDAHSDEDFDNIDKDTNFLITNLCPALD